MTTVHCLRFLTSIVLAACLFRPPAFAQQLRLEQSEQAISVLRGDKTVLVYNIQPPPVPEGIDPIYARSGFLHPVMTPAGGILTAAYPADHAHQSGIFTAWVKAKYQGRSVDFWNLAGKTARVLHEKVVDTQQNADGSVSFKVDLLHRIVADPQVDVLREHWTIKVLPTDGSYYAFDLETTQEALTDDPLIAEKYHYGGVAFRGNTRWLLPSDGGKQKQDLEPNTISNNLGRSRVEGNHAHVNWVAISGQLMAKPSGLVMMGHPSNFRAPQAARLHPTKPYFVFSPCVDGEFEIDRQHPYQARFRFLVTDTLTDDQWIDAQWKAWIK